MSVFFTDSVPQKLNPGCSFPSVTPTYTPTPSLTPTPTQRPTPTPVSSCYRPCRTNADCSGGLVCGYNAAWGERRCHNQYCPSEPSCICSWQRPTLRPATSLTLTPSPEECPNGENGNLNCDEGGLINEVDLNILLASWQPLSGTFLPSSSSG